MSLDNEFTEMSSALDMSLNTSMESKNNKKESNELKTLIKKRGFKRSSLSKTLKTIKDSADLDLTKINFYINKLDTLKNEIEEFDSKIETKSLNFELIDDAQYQSNSAVNERYMDELNMALASLKCGLGNLSAGSTINNSTVEGPINNSNSSKLKLPNVELPKFYGQPEEFERFIFTFESILSKFNLTQFERYSYLLQNVYSSARDIVQSVPTGQDEYDTAKQLLTQAFSDKLTQQFSVIEKLIKLKLNSNGECYHWISEARTIRDQILRLKIDADTFCQYFLWNGMSNKFKRNFISVCNKSVPSLEEILSGAFDVFKRSQLDSSKTSVVTNETFDMSSNKNSIALATNIDYNSSNKKVVGCSLCNSDNKSSEVGHTLHMCTVYKNAKEKLDKIKELNGCLKCGWLNHTTQKCKYRFKNKCYICNNNYHYSFLCMKTKEPQNSTNVNCNASTVNLDVMNASNDSNILIPSFTLSAKSKINNKMKPARCMYDPASQVTFVTENFANKIDYKIVAHVNAKITGFNGSKLYKTKSIKFTTKIGNFDREIRALIVPEIKSKVTSSHFKDIAIEFKKYGIPLADKHFNANNEIDILLGADCIGIIPVHSCSFGPANNKSFVYYSAAGIMLTGDMNILKSNFNCLYLVKEFIHKIDNL